MFAKLINEWARNKQPTEKTIYTSTRLLLKVAKHLVDVSRSRNERGGAYDADEVLLATTVTTEQIRGWKDELLKSALHPKTIENHLGVVKSLFNWAVAECRLPRNPATPVKFRAKKAPRKDRRRGYTDEEARKILEAARNESDPVRCWLPWVACFVGGRLDLIRAASDRHP